MSPVPCPENQPRLCRVPGRLAKTQDITLSSSGLGHPAGVPSAGKPLSKYHSALVFVLLPQTYGMAQHRAASVSPSASSRDVQVQDRLWKTGPLAHRRDGTAYPAGPAPTNLDSSRLATCVAGTRGKRFHSSQRSGQGLWRRWRRQVGAGSAATAPGRESSPPTPAFTWTPSRASFNSIPSHFSCSLAKRLPAKLPSLHPGPDPAPIDPRGSVRRLVCTTRSCGCAGCASQGFTFSICLDESGSSVEIGQWRGLACVVQASGVRREGQLSPLLRRQSCSSAKPYTTGYAWRTRRRLLIAGLPVGL